jgi:hypothetical protein
MLLRRVPKMNAFKRDGIETERVRLEQPPRSRRKTKQQFTAHDRIFEPHSRRSRAHPPVFHILSVPIQRRVFSLTTSLTHRISRSGRKRSSMKEWGWSSTSWQEELGFSSVAEPVMAAWG